MITLSLTLTAVAALPQEPSSPALRHPANPVVYLETPDVGDVLAAYEGAPLVRMVNDPGVQSAVSELLDSLAFDLDQVLSQVSSNTSIPPEALAAPGEALVRYLETVANVSASISILESAPGEFETTLMGLIETFAGLEQLREELGKYSAGHGGALPADLSEIVETPSELEDGWGRKFEYRVLSDGTGFELRSLGADGAFGGQGANADLEAASTFEDALGYEFLSRLGSTVVVEFMSDAAAVQAHGLLQNLMAETPLRPLGTSELGAGPAGSVTTFEIPDLWGVRTWTMLHGPHVVIGFGSSTPEAYFERVDGTAPSAMTAAARRDMDRRFGSLESATLLRGYFSMDGLVPPMRRLAEIADEDWGDMVSSAATSVWNMGLDGDRFVTDFYSALPGADDKLARCFAAEPLPEQLQAFVPHDSIIVGAVSMDTAMLYEQVLASMGSEPGLEDAPSLLAQLEQKYDFSLEHDVIGSLGSGALFYMLPVAGLMSVPGMAVVLELEDPAAFQKGLEGLLALLGDQGGGEFQIKYRPYRDHPLWYFTFQQQNGSPIPISPSLVIHDNYLLVTLTSLRAKKEIKRLTAEPGPLHPLFTNGLPEGATFAAYMDWATLGEGVYTAGRAMLSFMGMGGELPLDITLLPEPEIFTEFFEPTVMWSRWESDAIHTRWESSFGPETGTAIVVGAALVATAVANDALPLVAGAEQSRQRSEQHVELEVVQEASAEDGVSQEVETESQLPPTDETLSFLTTRLVVFKLEAGRYPAKLSELVEPTENYPRGFLGSSELPTDEWGRAFAYTVSEDGSEFRLWSFGSDGLDQQGEGDDLTGG